MAEKQFNICLILRNDSIENWENSQIIPRVGEPVLAKTAEGSWVFKIGDGENTFQNLFPVKASAIDVYGWAKERNFPFRIEGTGNAIHSVQWDSQQEALVFSLHNINGIPSYSAQDNDKFLRVKNGAPVWETVPNAEGVSF